MHVEGTPFEKTVMYGVGLAVLAMVYWVVTTTNDNERAIASDKPVFDQLARDNQHIQTEMLQYKEESAKQLNDIYTHLGNDNKIIIQLQYEIREALNQKGVPRDPDMYPDPPDK